MTVIKISKIPDFKEIEQELGLHIECVVNKGDEIYIETRDDLTDKQFDDAKKILKTYFPNEKIDKHHKKIKPRGLGKPNVDKTKLYKDLPIEQKIKDKKDALKHYERALSYASKNLDGTPKDQQKAEREIRKINHLKD